jgi:hypothetical protein
VSQAKLEDALRDAFVDVHDQLSRFRAFGVWVRPGTAVGVPGFNVGGTTQAMT